MARLDGDDHVTLELIAGYTGARVVIDDTKQPHETTLIIELSVNDPADALRLLQKTRWPCRYHDRYDRRD